MVIVDTLRVTASLYPPAQKALMLESADEIERLRIENKSLRDVFELERKPHSQLCLELHVLKNEVIAMQRTREAAQAAKET